MRVMVTGGAGYIGSVVVEQLLSHGHEVIVYDNLSKGHRECVPPTADFVFGDLLSQDLLTATLKTGEVEAVVHMAADSLVSESVEQPAKYYRNNVVGGLSLLDAMRTARVGRVVFSSTAAVFGEPAELPISEDDPTNPTNPYGATKLAFEKALAWYEAAYGLRYASLRYFNAAGATERCGEWHDPESHLIPIVLQAAAGMRAEVQIFGDDYATPDGTCVRDYIHVVDLAEAHVLALGNLSDRSVIYNLGCGGDGYSVREVIDIAQQVTGKEIRTKTGPRRPGDPALLVASSEKIKRELGWSPAFQDLRKIVGSAWKWLQNHPHGYQD